MTPYKEFAIRFKLLISKNPHLIATSVGHKAALEKLKKDIEIQKQKSAKY